MYCYYKCFVAFPRWSEVSLIVVFPDHTHLLFLCHDLANCRMTTTKSYSFVGGRDATVQNVALPA